MQPISMNFYLKKYDGLRRLPAPVVAGSRPVIGQFLWIDDSSNGHWADRTVWLYAVSNRFTSVTC